MNIHPSIAKDVDMAALIQTQNELAVARAYLTESSHAEGAELLIDYLHTTIATLEKRLSDFESLLEPLAQLAGALRTAVQTEDQAKHAWDVSSDAPKEILAIRDRLEIAQCLTRRARGKYLACKASLPGLGTSGALRIDPNSVGMFQVLTDACAISHSRGLAIAIQEDVWNRWVDQEPSIWDALLLARSMREAESESKKQRDQPQSGKQNEVADPEALRGVYRRLVADRHAKKEARLIAARRNLEMAERAVSK